MTDRRQALWGLLAAAAGACAAEAVPAPAVPPCPTHAVNAAGIGTPCSRAIDCEDLAAVSCPVASHPGDPPFCTRYCNGAQDATCGDQARCVALRAGVWACVPVVCAAKWSSEKATGVTLPCTATATDGSGLGRGCSTPADCPGGKAQYCTRQHDPQGGLALCTWPCSRDADCGPGGFCHERAVGAGVSAYCVPASCRASAAPASGADAAGDSSAGPDPGPDAGPDAMTATAIDAHTEPPDAPLSDALLPDAGLPDAPLPDAPAPPKYGFVSLLTGKVAVVDLAKMKHVVSIGQGSKVIHGVGVQPGQQQVYVPSNLENSLDLFTSDGDPTKWTMVASHKAPIPLGQVRGSADGQTIAMNSGYMPTMDGMPQPTPQHVAIFRKAAGAFTTVEVPSALTLGMAPQGDRVYVGSWVDRSVVALSVATNKVVGNWSIPTQVGSPNWYGPASVAVSPDGKWVASGNLGGKSATIFDAQTGAVVAHFNFSMLGHWVAFSPNGTQLYVVLWGKLPGPGTELANASIPAQMVVLDIASKKEIATITWTWLLAHVSVPAAGSSLYLTGSWGTVLRYDIQTFALTGQEQLSANLPMPAMTMGF